MKYQVKIERSDVVPDMPWDVEVTLQIGPTHSEITATEVDLGAMAAKYGGRNDGWGCFSQS